MCQILERNTALGVGSGGGLLDNRLYFQHELNFGKC